MNTYALKTVSALEKCFIEDSIENKTEIKSLSMLSNERLSFQLLYVSNESELYRRNAFKAKLRVDSPIKDNIILRTVEQVPVRLPVYTAQSDDDYLKKTPGLYPDLLLPFSEQKDSLIFVENELRSIFVTVENRKGIKSGKYPIVFEAVYENEVLAKTEIEIDIKEGVLPKLDIFHTEWFYADCLAQYYDCEVWSEKHWKIIENFMKGARNLDVNTILTPVFTPPLDTLEGGERLTTQLVDVYLEKNKYTFSYNNFDHWVSLCEKLGFEHFEISHFFTQWGAKHAPKVMAYVDGEYKKIFGWETEAAGKEYSEFLHAFLDDFIPHVKKLGIDKKCLYHISDEPKELDLDNYTKARNVVKEKLKDYMIIDALSDYGFYKTGAISHPIPATSKIEPFLENNIPDLWAYYCCSQFVDVSNRFLSMPGYRTRIIGAQLYKYNIKGYLHWGFNFYNTRYSVKPLEPYLDTCGEYFTPAGDCFLVYPSQNGECYSSLHAELFYMGLQDMRALKYCESKIGREKTLELVDEGIEQLTFKVFPRTQDYILNLREKTNNI